MENADVEIVTAGGAVLAYVVRRNFSPDSTTFVTPNSLNQQLGFIVYAAGTSIARHRHLPVARSIEGTTEVILVRKGLCALELYNVVGDFVRSVELRTGDIVVLVAGGHGFRMLEDTILVEVKQGPYSAAADKERF